MKVRRMMAASALATVLVVGAGCATEDGTCKATWAGRYQNKGWPDFSDSEHFAKIALGGDLDNLNRTLDGVVQNTKCEVVNFPSALERFWLLIR